MTRERAPGCPLCDALALEDGVENLVVRREPSAFVILNKYPYNSGHVMVVPTRHVEMLSDLGAEEAAAVWGLIARTVDLLRGELGAQGVNVGVNLGEVSGRSIDHLHVHVVPRWQGDTNFMPVVAETKVLVATLAETWARFAEAMRTWDA